ncbi:MAG TPA: tetratricopeptide repeat protein [Spirochaetia bacterium]|nr:tetratricopeptide repeat protein [Spirochaetia bacterium]
MKMVIRALFLAFIAAAGTAAFAGDARGAYLEGLRAQGTEDYALAIEKFKEALSANPAYVEPMIGLAQSFLLLGEYDEAARFAAMARVRDRNNLDLVVLDGRIRIGQGDTASARSLFGTVLTEQPNNVEARMGMAEADIADGRARTALAGFAQSLKLAPESTKAILSLAQLSDEIGDQESAGRYYELALKSHASDAHVQLAAAAWLSRTGDYASAEKHAQIALTLAPEMDRARTLLGEIYLQTNRPQDATNMLQQVVSKNRDDPLAWYALAIAYRRSADATKALTSFASGLDARPEDEIARVAQEATAIESLPMDDAQRRKMSAFHVAQGQAQEDRNFLEKALAEYRRALILDPTSRDARVAYARIYRSQGFPGKYLSELQVLAKLGVKDTFVQDEIEGLTSQLADTISRSWGYDQYNIERRRYVMPVYTMPERNRFLHTLASEDVARYFASMLGRYDSISVPDGRAVISGFDDAFRQARSAGTDYFIVLQADEEERSFQAAVDVFLSRTGALIASFSAFRTGNDRVRDSFQKLAEQVAGTLQPRGTLLVRRFNQGLVDEGAFQGLKKGDALIVVRRGGVRLAAEKPGLTYDERDVLGDFQVTGTDEGVSEGTVKIRGYFDYVNAGDMVISPAKPAAKPPATLAPRGGNIVTRLLRIGR